MSRITITLHIDIPDGARVETPDVEYVDGHPRNAQQPLTVPQEPPGLMEVPPYDPDEIARPAAQALAACPVHHKPWKTVPAGVSKKNGRPYDAFLACPERGCDQKPWAA